MKLILVITFDYNKVFFGYIHQNDACTVRYYDIVLRDKLNSSELTEILKTVKYNNM